MSEPEELILEGAHAATRLARDLWRRHGPIGRSSGLELASIRGRLEAFVLALHGTPIPVSPIDAPAPATWLSRLASRRMRSAAPPAVCGTDGRGISLAPVLNVEGSEEESLALYRLLAVQQSLRVVRRSRYTFAGLGTPQARDLFRIADAAIVDRWVAVHTPGLLPALSSARAVAAMQRRMTHPMPRVDPLERDVLRLLGAHPLSAVLDLPVDASAEECARWADRVAPDYRAEGHYRPIAPVFYWGEFLEPGRAGGAPWYGGMDDSSPRRTRRPRVAEMRRRPRARHAEDDEDDSATGAWVIRADEPQESVEDPFGLTRPADRDQDTDPEGLGDSLSELPEARVVRTPQPPVEVLRSGEPAASGTHAGSRTMAAADAVSYPEWDCNLGHYREPGAIVRDPGAPLGDAAWATACLARHARLVRCVRSRFERLRPRPIRFFRQIDGTDLDVAAYVAAAADLRAGVAMDGRLYLATRAARRELAVALLVDVSASTDGWVSANRRIVDVEKEALLVVCEALDALGDPYALFAFSGEGATRVEVRRLKTFEERSSALVHRRLAALDSDGYTRLGASLRHVTATLCRVGAASRLLLLLSDGKPNDIDAYEGRYGIEDTRQAVAEARRQGVTVFCLTVDREAPSYARRIFGRQGFAVLHRSDQLPTVVVDVLRQLIKT